MCAIYANHIAHTMVMYKAHRNEGHIKEGKKKKPIGTVVKLSKNSTLYSFMLPMAWIKCVFVEYKIERDDEMPVVWRLN